MFLSNSKPNLKRSLAQTAARTIFVSALLLMSAAVAGTPGASQAAVTVSEDSVTLTWNPSNGAEGYYLVYAPYDAEPFEGPFTDRIDVGNQTSIPFEIHEGEGFHVAVQAYNEAGTSSISNVVSFIRSIEEREAAPVVQILANHTANDLAVPEGTPVTLSVALDHIGGDHGTPEVWILVDTPFGFYSYHRYAGWVAGTLPYEASLSETFDLPSLSLPNGHYTFYLAVDDNADRIPDGIWWDAVSVRVAPSGVGH
jgi:hypothetical protein